MFSFNNPFGACPRCQGFGNTIDFDINLAIPAPGKTLEEGAIEPWTRPKYRAVSRARCAASRGSMASRSMFRGRTWKRSIASWCCMVTDTFPGVYGFFEQLERKKYKLHVRVFLSRYRGYALCPEVPRPAFAR
jgi:excinuclease ABC subunit A